MTAKKALRTQLTPAGSLSESGLQRLIGYELAQATVVTNAVFTEHVGHPLGLRRVEFSILMLIDENPGCSGAKLARALDVTAPHITAWIGQLEKSGWVVREQNSADKRAQHLHLTQSGQQLVTQVSQLLLDGEKATLNTLSAGERAILIELLHKVACCRAA
jgi:DNA-binding MarR family transcriptional regulator